MSGANEKLIASWVDEGARVLDLGCGNGSLLSYIAKEKKANAIGIEIDEEMVAACIGKGLQVINADIESGLDIIEDKSFDCAVLSQTLQELRNPGKVLEEMMRVSKRSVVSIINASHWGKRLDFLAGRVPKHEEVGTNEINRLITVADFERLCSDIKVRIIEKKYLANGTETSLALMAKTAAYLIDSSS